MAEIVYNLLSNKHEAWWKLGGWGYTKDRHQAKPLCAYWRRRFARDSQRCNRAASFVSP